MIARRAVWTDARVRALLARFVPCADEVGFLQRVASAEGELFRRVAEQGHYAGRRVPTDTRQGLYATTADGRLLASINANDPGRVARMLEQAWAAWEALPAEARAPAPAPASDVASGRRRPEQRYPVGGLVLRVTSRDLPRAPVAPTAGGAAPPGDWRAAAWNLDYAWLRAEEAAHLVPTPPEVGATLAWPAPLTDRLLRVHLVDNVRGQTYPVKADQVERARLTTTVTGLGSGEHQGQVLLRLEGEVRWVARGTWPTGGLGGGAVPSERGLEARLLGTARFDPTSGRFTAFEAVAVGSRWGATQYNGRADDPGPAPIGYLIELAGDGPEERVAPASLWEYRGW